MPWPIEADRATQEHYAREHRRRERLTRLRRRKSAAAWLTSLVLHIAALGSLVRAASLEPAPPTLEVFTAELPTETPAPKPATARMRSSVRRAPRPARIARPKGSVVARPRVTPHSEAEAVRAPESAPLRQAPPDAKPQGEPVGSEPVSVAAAPPAPAEAMPLTPARTLTAIEPPPAALPPATTVVAQAQTDPVTPTPEAPQTIPPMASEPAPAHEPPSTTPDVTPAGAPRPTPPPPAPAVPPAPPTPIPRQQPAPAPPSSPAPPAPVPPAPRRPASGTAVAQATSEPERDAASPPDTSPIEAARENVEAAKARATSALGLGLGQLRIQIDGARARTTERAVETISGTLIGGAGDRVTVRIGDTVTEVADGRRFSTSVPLKPGLNHVRVVAVDGRGAEVEETVSIDYTAPIRLAITEPRDGHTLTGDDPPLVVVHGTVDDAAVSSVWVVAGDRRVAVPVVGGRFRQTVPVLQPTVQVRVEAPATEGRAPGSAAVTVHAAGMTPAVAVLLDWPGDGAVPAVVTAAWRSRPDRIEGVQRVALQTAEGDARPNFFYLRNPRPGVYTFVLAYQSGAAGFVEPALYIAAGGRQVRKLSPVALNGSGRAVVARVLMPQGVLWEDEDWFTGRSANGEGVTKFRFPDGISWTERTGGAAR